jgi:chromosome segregation ATPase
MDDQQRQRINGAAQEFTDALVAAYRTVSDNTVVAQQMGAQQIEYFFDAVMDNLRAQAGGTSQIARQMAGQQRLAQEATRELAQLTTDNYMDLLDSVFSFYQGRASRTQRRAEEARTRIEEAETRAEQAETRAEQAERARGEAESQTEEAKRGASAAKRRATEAQKRAREAESRAEELERGRSEAESRGGDEEGGAKAAAIEPRSRWVRTSGSSKVRGRNTRARNRSSGRRS